MTIQQIRASQSITPRNRRVPFNRVDFAIVGPTVAGVTVSAVELAGMTGH
jgi:hypothetical protein